MIEGALASVGSQDYLEAVAIDHPETFCTLLGKLIPKDIKLTMPEVKKPLSMFEVARRLVFLLRECEAEQGQHSSARKRRA